MVSGIRFFGGSGSMGQLTTGRLTPAAYYSSGDTLPADRALPNVEIFEFEVGANGSPNRLGFFGSAGAPNSAVIVGQYQDRSHRTNDTGDDLGAVCNNKFTGSASAEVSGVAFTAGLENIPAESGTLLCRFAEPNGTAVITQQATFRAVDFGLPGPATGDANGAPSGVPNLNDLASNITIQAAQLPDTDGFTGNTSWSEISDGGAELSLADQSAEANLHDFHLIVSASPAVAGRKIDFGYVIQLEFL